MQVSILKLVSAGAALALLACVSSVDPPPLGPTAEGSVVVVLPDTQFYACEYGEIFERQTRWIVEQRELLDIALALHTGDIVDADIDAQWQLAARSLKLLDGRVPYLVTTGNHDLSAKRSSMFARYFGTRMLDMFGAQAEAYEPGHSDNSYAVARIADRDWLVLGLEFGPRDEVVSWADRVLREHADLPAIVFTHAYLYSDGNRYDRRIAPRQPYHPDHYALTPQLGINDGEDLWNKLVLAHENVRLVLSGHTIPDGTARKTVQRPSGSLVHQVLANYQFCDVCPCAEREGGGGYLRILEFTDASIEVSTYSPHKDEWLRDGENEFTLPL